MCHSPPALMMRASIGGEHQLSARAEVRAFRQAGMALFPRLEGRPYTLELGVCPNVTNSKAGCLESPEVVLTRTFAVRLVLSAEFVNIC